MSTVQASFITLLLVICPSLVGADEAITISVEEYMELKEKTPNEADNYLSGVLSGYILANAMLEKLGHNKLYCMPENTYENKESLNNLISLTANLMKETKKTSQLKESVASFILWSLVEAYPCNNKQP